MVRARWREDLRVRVALEEFHRERPARSREREDRPLREHGESIVEVIVPECVVDAREGLLRTAASAAGASTISVPYRGAVSIRC